MLRFQLKDLARRLGVNLTGLAAYLGVSRVAVSRWMNGHSAPQARYFRLIRLSLWVDPEVLHLVASCQGDTFDRLALLEMLCPGAVRRMNDA